MYSSCFLAPGDVQASHLFLSKEDSLMTCGGVTFFFHLKTSFCFFPSLFSMSLLPREPWKKAKILNYDICSLDWFHTHRFTLTHKHISNLSKTLLAGLKMIWYFPIICMHVASCMIVILTMLLSSIINMPVAWVPILFFFCVWFSRPSCMAPFRLRALFHRCTSSLETSHATVLGSLIVCFHRKLTFYGHSGPWQIAGSF